MSSESRGLKAIDQLIEDLDKYLKSQDMDALKEKSVFLADITIELFIRVNDSFNMSLLNDIEQILKKYGFRLYKYELYPKRDFLMVYVDIQTW